MSFFSLFQNNTLKSYSKDYFKDKGKSIRISYKTLHEHNAKEWLKYTNSIGGINNGI